MLRLMAIFILISTGVSCSLSPTHKDYYLSAQYYFSQGAWEDSLSSTNLAIQADPANEEAYILRAQNLSKLGEFTSAHQQIHDRLTLRPHSSKLNLALIHWHQEFGSKTAALELAKRMIQRDPSQLAAHKIVAEMSIELKNWPDAELSLAKIVKEDKFDEESALALGKLYLKESRLENALVVFNQLYQGKSKRVDAAKYLAWIHADNGNTTEANKYIRYLSLEKQNDQFTQKIITRNLLNSQDVDKITVLSHYLKLHSDDWGQHQIYLAYQEAGLKEKALDLLADIWNQNPEKKWAAINYANHLHEIGDHQVAEVILQKASIESDVKDQELIASVRQGWIEKDSSPKVIRQVANTQVMHKVKRGETLGGIAHKYLGDAKHWDHIFTLNQLKIKDAAILPEGVELLIPEMKP